MPPRGKGKAAAKAVAIKQEAELGGLCVRGIRGRELNQAVYYKKTRSPQWLRDYYDQKVKYSQSMNKAQKQEFLENFLGADGFETDFFAKIKATIHEDVDKNDHIWHSWKKVTENMDEDVAKLSVEQGKLEFRPHEKLDHDDSRTKELPFHQKHEFRWNVDSSSSSTTVRTTLQNEDQKEPAKEAQDLEKSEHSDKVQDAVSRLKKAKVQFTGQEDEFMLRLGNFKDNEYVRKTFDEATASLNGLKRKYKAISKDLDDLQKADDELQKRDEGAEAPADLEKAVEGAEGRLADFTAGVASFKGKLVAMRKFTQQIAK